MLSICIPIHDYYVYPLVRRLATEAEQLGVSDKVEIVCIDDHSSDYYVRQNDGIASICTFIRLDENIGRSRIRNLFLDHTRGSWLLFLDNDSLPPEHFLSHYLKHTSSQADVVVGGRIYDNRGNDEHHRLRYLYGTKVESQSAEIRSQNPYRSFMTNNFMIRRAVLEKIQFDTRLSLYGHEDTLFGYRLQQNAVPILHIDNPVINGYVETNPEFINKTVEGIDNLVKICEFLHDDPQFRQSVRLLRAYDTVCSKHLLGVVKFLFKLFKKPLEKQLIRGRIFSIKGFNFFKLGTLIEKLDTASFTPSPNPSLQGGDEG